MQVGAYSGEIEGAYRDEALLAALAELPARLTSPAAEVVAAGRNRNVRVTLPRGGGTVEVLVKAFGRESGPKNAMDRRRGTKARRTWEAAHFLAVAGVATPVPIGYLERWQGVRLVESYYLAAFLPGRVSFTDALNTLYHDYPECARVMELLEVVAAGIRAMHDGGFQHNDLGNQNILLRPVGETAWADPCFIDLNRGRCHGHLGARERARDLSRIALPSDFLRVFFEMYWREVPPPVFLKWERRYRRLATLHRRTRRWRHPMRHARQARLDRGKRVYPGPRELWIWDERSGQAVSTLRSRDRTPHYAKSRPWVMALDSLRAAPGVWAAYQALRRGAFQSAVTMSGRIGVSVEPRLETFAQERALLAGLGPIPAMVRFYHHESVERRRFRVEAVEALRSAGHPVSIALVQDRRAVRDPGRWQAFGEEVLGGVGPVELVEVGHAINRVKWGIWDFAELRGLYAATAAWRRAFPEVRLSGPAVIDFEYPFALSALRALPAGVQFDALSLHLYVDRRGAPENRQSGFGAVEKFALARAIARRCGVREGGLVVSEVNWPIVGTGVYSPVGAPYVSPGPRFNDPSVSEDQYADYLLRYLCLALCSGLVERVFWWRLVARGYGLVDDTDASAWRPRPAYRMLQRLLMQVGDSTFERAELPGADGGGYRFLFRRADGERVALAYAHPEPVALAAGTIGGHFEDAFGAPLASPPSRLSGRPVYQRHVAG
jgi:hypothetical protein